MKMVFMGSHGSDRPTHAVLLLLQVKGALEERHEVELPLVDEDVVLMKDVFA